MTRSWIGAVMVLALAGCASDASLGTGDGTGGTTTQEVLGQGGWGGYSGTPQGCEGRADPFEPVQVWTGYVEGGGPDITLRFSVIDATQVAGEMIVGSTPNPGYLAPVPGQGHYSPPGVYGEQGFNYTIQEGTRTGDRIQFYIRPHEPWCAWCGEQPSYGSPQTYYGCLPPGAVLCPSGNAEPCTVTDAATGEQSLCSYTLVAMCATETPCECDATHCGPVLNRSLLDMTIDDPLHATGTFAGQRVRFDIPPAP